ncbi:hypothetical protein CNEONATNEC26_02233 [Clostridium neonatale]|nr:hypothetical protein CNEONATNEC26_02233 [Clostridium neonatale]
MGSHFSILLNISGIAITGKVYPAKSIVSDIKLQDEIGPSLSSLLTDIPKNIPINAFPILHSRDNTNPVIIEPLYGI